MGEPNGHSSEHPLDPLLRQPSPWLGGEGPHADLVLSTRIRLARNLQSVPFTHRAREEQLHGVLVSVSDAAKTSGSFRGGLFVRMNELSPVDRQILVERRLVMAAMLIVQSDERISQIAYSVGFRDVSNFNHSFKRRFAMSPREYRNRHDLTAN